MAKKKKPVGKSPSGKHESAVPENTETNEALPVDPADDVSEASEYAFPIVGVGASAGGLEAFSLLLQALPAEPGVAIVFVQHLAPKHASALPALLSAATSMPVEQVVDGIVVKVNHIYVIPPNTQMELRGCCLQLAPRPTGPSQHTPIDVFFRSLAEELKTAAVGVVMSGTASDGSNGLREIKAVGGITLAQDPTTARYEGMPQAAINTGIVDVALPPDRLAGELVRIAQHPFVTPAVRVRREGDTLDVEDGQMAKIFALLRSASGVDFTQYKPPTIKRRLQRRMVLQKLTNVDHYIKFLQDNPDEVSRLYQDVLIHVTRFFREPESFTALADHIFPKLLEGRSHENPIRIWVPGCSTGEEPYSIAMALLEFLEEHAANVAVQIFATDVSESAIDTARSGVYAPSIADDVSPERLRRFFTKVDGSYRITKLVRDTCVFARQDLTRDPPFSKLDLIVCRNVLIYLGAALQKKLVSMFHYALKSTGFLVLGSAETTGTLADLFAVADKKHRIYTKRNVELMHSPLPAFDYAAGKIIDRSPRPTTEPRAIGNVQNEANRMILDRYGPPAVIVDGDMQIIQFRGQTGRYLEPAPGDASLNLLKMAREGLLYGLRTALNHARQRDAAVRKEGLRVKENGSYRDLNLEVMPLATTGEKRHYLVVFEDVTDEHRSGDAAAPVAKTKKKSPKSDEKDLQIQQLQQEVAASRDYLQSIIQDLEAANEELQSANEEILSSNEELQSTNEELDTAKEELQSTNEELNTVNEELHGRNEELSRVNSDLVNLLGSVQIAIVIVASDLRIRRFTPVAERVLNLIPGDVGRPISQIKPNIDCPDLEQIIHDAIENIAVQQRNVQDAQGRWYSLTVRPYKNVDNRIDGAVLTLFDINEGRSPDASLRGALQTADAFLEVVGRPVLLLDNRRQIRRVNAELCEAFDLRPSAVLDRPIEEIDGGAWNVAAIRRELDGIYRDGQTREHLVIESDFPRVGRRRFYATLRKLDFGAAAETLIWFGLHIAESDQTE